MVEPEAHPRAGVESSPRLTPAQLRTLLAYARSGTIAATAADLDRSPRTVKNLLSHAYDRLGARTGVQAIYRLMGGDQAAAAATDPRRQPACTHHEELGRLRRRVRELERSRSRQPRSRWDPAAEGAMPVLVDGQLSLRELRQVARIGDNDAEGTPTASFTELVDWLSYHVRPAGWKRRGTPARGA